MASNFLWLCVCVYVCVCYACTPNNTVRRKNVKELKDKALESLVGDGGFRAGIPGKTRQSGVNASTVCTVPLPPSKNTYFRLDHHGDEGEKDDGASKVQAPPVQAPVPEAREKEPQEQQQGIE